ncbi:expressed unknown protein [Ectocarpus siliculosus]|uniref:Uncharacterized protein n=1 Tax=Ectocarpus siliculosus TaxID=2880 RepID=D8LLB9_ECTSI|nr:expressed unknown protein [Ectocarpus siliculosus]|eukprot:CBN77117.1 expressed unknown protein [Ectocarpus siliculosus]
MTMEVAGWRDLDWGQEAVSLSSLPTLAGGSRTISECVRMVPRPTRLYEAGPALLFLYGRRNRSFKGVLVCLNSSTDGGASPHLNVLELTPLAIGVGEATMGFFEGSHEAWDQFLVEGGGSLVGRCPSLGCRGLAGTDLTLISRPCSGIRHSVLEGRGDVQMPVSFLPRFTTIGTLQTAPAWVLGTSPEDGVPDTVEPWEGEDSALTTDEPAANARWVRRRNSMTTQENGVTDVYKGDVSYVPLAWLRCSPIASDWIAGSILCGLQSKFGRLIVVVYTSMATAWVWFEGDRRESSVVMAASTFLLGSLFLWNYQAVARAISPFGNTRDQLITLILASLSFFYSILAGLYHPRGMLGGEVWWPTIAIVLLVCLLSATARECHRRDRRVDAKSWVSLCRRAAVDFQEVGMPLREVLRGSGADSRGYYGTIGGTQRTVRLQTNTPRGQPVTLENSGWSQGELSLTGEEAFARCGGTDPTLDAWLAAFVGEVFENAFTLFNQGPAVVGRINACLAALAATTSKPPSWAEGIVTLSQVYAHDDRELISAAMERGWTSDEFLLRRVVVSAKPERTILSLPDGFALEENIFPVLVRPKELIKIALRGSDYGLLTEQPNRQAGLAIESRSTLYDRLCLRGMVGIQDSYGSNHVGPLVVAALLACSVGPAWQGYAVQVLPLIGVCGVWRGWRYKVFEALSRVVETARGLLSDQACVLAGLVAGVISWNVIVVASGQSLVGFLVGGIVAAKVTLVVGVAMLRMVYTKQWSPGVELGGGDDQMEGLCHLALEGRPVPFQYRMLVVPTATCADLPALARVHVEAGYSFSTSGQGHVLAVGGPARGRT